MNVLLVGNYLPDGQESMRRYADLVADGLRSAGASVTLLLPRPRLNRQGRGPSGIWKWIGYADKFVLAPGDLRTAAHRADVVHVCDHSNALYIPARKTTPQVVTCHDLLAVRGALGEGTDCPASAMGRHLQRLILDGLNRADAIACASLATRDDARRLLPRYRGHLTVVPNALNYPYRVLDPAVVTRRLAVLPGMDRPGPYLLHVGSNLRRKNRDGALRILARIADAWGGFLVFAGQALDEGLRALALELGVAHRVVEIVKPDNANLEALYNGALALLFPSRFEGFGWPITEAQACGCPVICADRAPFPEVSGGAAALCDLEDESTFARAILDLATHPAQREPLVARGLANAARYRPEAMTAQLIELYGRLLVHA